MKSTYKSLNFLISMMSHANFNYTNDVTPSQEHQEYGVYDPNAVSLVYVPTIYSVQYTGVTCYEVNGTTYYNYNLYEVPVLGLYCYPVYDYGADVYPENYQYEDNTSFEDVSEGNSFSQEYYSHYSTSYYDSIRSELPSNSSGFINSYSESLYTSVVYHSNFNNNSTINNNRYASENNVSFTETSNTSYNCIPTSNENVETTNPHISYPSRQVENPSDTRYEDTVSEIVNDSDINTSACNTEDDVNNYDECCGLEQDGKANEADFDTNCKEHALIEESRVLDWSIEVDVDDVSERDNDLYKEYNCSFIAEERKVPDWSVEVVDEDETIHEHDDAIKGNFSTSNDMNPYNSAEVIKYLKDNLYLYALSGYMSLKESIPVVDILPVINEETEFVEVDVSFEGAVENSTHKEEKLRNDAEKNEVADVCFERFQPLVECPALEYTVEYSEQVTKNISGLAEENLSSVPTAYTSKKNNSECHVKQRDEMVMNDVKLGDTKLISSNNDCTSPSSEEELKISEKNVLIPVETDNIFNATLKLPSMHSQEKENMLKRQNECIKIVDESGPRKVNSLCPSNDTDSKIVGEVKLGEELILNQVDSNHITNTACHVRQDLESNGECHSETNAEKLIQSDGNVHRKTKKRNFILLENGSATCVVVQEKSHRF